MDPSAPVAAKQMLYWLSYLYFPVAGALVWWMVRRGTHRILASFFLLGLTVLAYARFVEPRILLVKSHEVEICGNGLPGTVKAAVVADFHYGIFPNAMPLERIVSRLNRLTPDLVLIPGDFTYHLDEQKFDKTFASLGALDAPAYAVMGNHDVGFPGDDVTKPLTEALDAVGVAVLNPGDAVFSARGKFLRIAGMRDLWAVDFGGQDFGHELSRDNMATIYLQHNPDTAKRHDIGTFDLMVSGHTHGGQIYIPGLTCAVTFACDTLRYGYADSPAGKLFVTGGTGMVGLPLRFGMPPRIDVLNLKVNRCRVEAGNAFRNMLNRDDD